MKAHEHAAILYAYLARIKPADLELIAKARKDHAYAALNLGNSSQLAAIRATMEACDRAVEGLIEHDRNLIRDVIANKAP